MKLSSFIINFTKNDENYKMAKNHNILSRKEIKDLTSFFFKESPDKILEKIVEIKCKINRLQFAGYVEDCKNLDALRKYIKIKK